MMTSCGIRAAPSGRGKQSPYWFKGYRLRRSLKAASLQAHRGEAAVSHDMES